jgi:hypothetical protein
LVQSSPNPIDKEDPHESETEHQPNSGPFYAGNGGSKQGSATLFVNLRKIKNASRTDFKALVDRGANGSIAGSDMRVIERSGKTINLCGLDDHTVRDLYLAKAGGVVKTSSGEIIIIVHHCADMTNDSKTIISVPQMEAFGCVVDDRSGNLRQGHETYA